MKRIRNSAVALSLLGAITYMNWVGYTYAVKYELYNQPYYGSYI